MAHGKIALRHVIARKAGLSYESFISIQQAVYRFNYRHGEKVGGRYNIYGGFSQFVFKYHKHLSEPFSDCKRNGLLPTPMTLWHDGLSGL